MVKDSLAADKKSCWQILSAASSFQRIFSFQLLNRLYWPTFNAPKQAKNAVFPPSNEDSLQHCKEF